MASEGDESCHEPIAIVGMGMRLPGDIHTAQDLWKLLAEKRTTQCRIPGDRFNVSAFHSPSGKAGCVAMQYGHFLAETDNLRHFDASFFSMSKQEVDILDPQQRMLLEVVYECMQSSGQVDWRGKNIGCYVGVWGEDWLDLHAKNGQDAGIYRIAGGHDFALSNRISYEYDLKGPSFTMKSACSSSMIALHEAFRAIQSGDCSAAIVAGTNLILSPTMSIAMTEQGVLSPDGKCKTFDISANGFARGEAINAIYIKRLSDAIKDNDPIRAIIRSTASNCDGKTAGLAMPSSESHEAVMRKAYKEANLEPTQTAFVEAHGTGTFVGDPLEANAIARVFGGEKGVYIGSVKPNLGHSEGASGISSIMKTVLALENRTIPPNINFSTPNPKIPFEATNMAVPIESIPWPNTHALRASVNSFGIGGANAHIVLESASSFGLGGPESAPTARTTNGNENRNPKTKKSVLVLSAANSHSLKGSLLAHQHYIEENSSRMKDISYTLCNRREHLSTRVFCVTDESAALQFSPITKARKTPQLTMVFTGQGAQWAGMAKELMEDYPSFYDDIDSLSYVLSKLEPAPSWDVKEELIKSDSESNLGKAEYAQPLVTAIQVALVNLLRACGILPTAVLGHSSGEIAAAYAAQAITSEEAILIAYYRGQVTKGHARPGGMAAVGLGRDQVRPYLVPGVVIGCENSPRSVTLSGDKSSLEEVCKNIKTDMPDVFLRHLKVEMAYHSHHMRDFGEHYETLLQEKLDSRATVVPLFSSVQGKVIEEAGKLNAAYWRANLESPVLFNSAVKLLLDSRPEDQLFLEIGPHGALAGPIRQILQDRGRLNDTYVTALNRGKDCTESFLKTTGELYLKKIPVNFSYIASPGSVLTDLPRYRWHHEQEYWSESRVSKEWRLRKFPHHEILGSRTMEGDDLQPEWRNILRLKDVPWLRDHQVIDNIVFPCAGYLSMAGEGIRQVSSARDWTLRDVVIHTALVLSESTSVEMKTNFRPVRLTTTLDSKWWEFTVSSYNESVWTKHCSGKIKSGTNTHTTPRTLVSHPRLVPSPYTAIKKVGLNYGPAFQGLERVSALPNKTTACAALSEPEPTESFYAVHPTTIDHCLQLLLVASCEGIFRRIEKLCVPTSIQELYVGSGKGTVGLMAEAVAVSCPTRALSGDILATSGEEVFLTLTGVGLSPLYDDVPIDSPDTVAAAKLEWKPDLDFLDIGSLIQPQQNSEAAALVLEKLTILSIIEIGHRISELTVETEYLQKFFSWINLQISRASDNTYELVADTKSLSALDSKERISLISGLSKAASENGYAMESELISRILKNCEEIVEGHLDGIDILLPNDGLTRLYNQWGGRADCHDFFAAAGHSKPTLRVLEIGAGTGGTTAVVLKGLTSASERMYSTYTYSDISSGFFVAARERFKDHQGLEYRTLDISKDPIDQGFQGESFDLIVAANVLHATPSLHTTLTNVRKLLAPHGYLFLQELTPLRKTVNLIMGILPGWWLGADDGRSNEPYVDLERWNTELKMAGFSGADAAVHDEAQPYQINSYIVSRPAKTTQESPRVTLLHNQQADSTLLGDIRKTMGENGFQTDLCTLQQTPPADQNIISLLEIESPVFENISESGFTAFKQIIATLNKSGILWVMRSGQIQSSDPRFGVFLGLARTLRLELSVPIATLEVDCIDDSAYTAIAQVFRKFQERRVESDMDPDYEFVLSRGEINTGRYHAVSVAQQLAVTSTQPEALKLDIGRHGLLRTLRWVPCQDQDLGPDEVVIESRAIGLNFKDVLVSMGIIENSGLGVEGSGIVSEVGPAVTNLKVGDRVMYLAPNCFSTRNRIAAGRCVRLPSNISWEEAATMPCVYATVIHSLLDVGGLQTGQSVLIHSACGGIGLAAIQICQYIGGVKIYVTVGTEQKAEYLVNTFSIPRENILNSRNTSFLPAVKTLTNGRGVDLVLNSLSGELLHASWKCVAEFGKMLEIGKRDFIGKAQLNMDLFEANRSFHGIDIALFNPAKCRPVLSRIVTLFESGSIKPITPMKLYSAVNVEESFRYMQKGAHIGKIVVTIPERRDELPWTPTVQDLELNPNASYLLVGGLGGLGRAVATWMVEKGARHLIFMSRSAGKSTQDKAFFRELESQSCCVQAFAGNVVSLSDVEDVVKVASKPIKGVLQMSMVLKDRSFLDMSYSEWKTAVNPKVQGTWNLHYTLPQDLDFFVMTSSISGAYGNPGQANYAAANTFLSAFVQYRKSQGLAASVLDIGVIGDIGYVSQNATIHETLRQNGMYFLSEKDFLESLHWTIAKSGASHSVDHLAIGIRSEKPLSDPSNRVIWKRDARMGIYHNADTSSSTDTRHVADKLKPFMSSVELDPSMLYQVASVELVTNEIGIMIYSFMLQPVEDLDVTRSLAALGVDSLVTIEIRNWMKRAFREIEISTLEILNAGTIKALGALVIELLKKKFETKIRESGDTYLVMKAP